MIRQILLIVQVGVCSGSCYTFNLNVKPLLRHYQLIYIASDK
jgi:hypothetical protein